MKKATIKEVAELAQVSVATVSRALNDPETVKEATRKRVLSAVESLSYDPDPVAQALRSSEMHSIATIVPNITNSIMAEMTRGVHEELADHGYHTVLFNSSEDFKREEHFCQILKNIMVNGAIFVTGSGGVPPVGELAKSMPVCLINRVSPEENVDHVLADEEEGIRLLCYHLHRLGHERIAFITGLPITTATQNKLRGYRGFLEKRGLPLREEYSICGYWTMEGAYMAMRELLCLEERPTAVIVGTDTMALGALSAIQSSNLRVPEDIAVTGFDQAPGGEYYHPPLTTLRYPNYEMGRLAARAILNRLKEVGGEKKEICLPLDILIRRSCGFRMGFEEGGR